jgi:hypothetical protein
MLYTTLQLYKYHIELSTYPYIIANALRPRDVDDIHNYNLSNDAELVNHVHDLMRININKLTGINNLKMKVDYIIFLNNFGC